MSGGRGIGGTLRAQAASLLVSVLWLFTLLAVFEWSVAPTPPSGYPLARGVEAAAGPVALAGDPAGSAVYAQLPAAPAIAEKRSSTSTAGAAKPDSDGAAALVAGDLSQFLHGTLLLPRQLTIRAPEGAVLAYAAARAPPRAALTVGRT